MRRISRRDVLRTTSAGALSMVGTSPFVLGKTKGNTPPSDRPNVLFILTDQQRWDSLSCNGNKVVHTPNLDRLASEGVNFTQDTCLSPLCGPSRAALLTGRLAHHHRCYGNYELYEKKGLAEDIPTFDELLHETGYECEYQGKWHTGYAHREVYRDGLKDHYLHLYHDEMTKRFPLPVAWKSLNLRKDRYTKLPYKPWPVDDMMLNAPQNGFSMPNDNEAGESYIPHEHSLTAWTTQRAIRYLRSGPKRPFSMTCSILHPHAPLIACSPYHRMFDPSKMPIPSNVFDDGSASHPRRPVPGAVPVTPEGLGSFMALYYGLVAEVDHWVGEILRALKEAGLEQNTLVVFTSDHGEMMGSHGTFSKANFHEEAFRVPLLMRLPGRIPAGMKSDAPANGMDIVPSILDFCGIQHPQNPLAGHSLRPLVEGKSFKRPYAFGEFYYRKGHVHAVRSREWKLILYHNGRAHLYKLQTDPGEQHNLLSPENRKPSHVDLAQELRGRLQAYLEEQGDPAHKTLSTLDA